jgi:hypothetical protein
MTNWRGWALIVGGAFAIGGLVVWNVGGGPVLLILGVIAIATGLLEPIYGRVIGRPPGGDWRPTDERFVDPETGKLVTVWFEPATGERRYVADEED